MSVLNMTNLSGFYWVSLYFFIMGDVGYLVILQSVEEVLFLSLLRVLFLN